jgi:hypothetical protein
MKVQAPGDNSLFLVSPSALRGLFAPAVPRPFALTLKILLDCLLACSLLTLRLALCYNEYPVGCEHFPPLSRNGDCSPPLFSTTPHNLPHPLRCPLCARRIDQICSIEVSAHLFLTKKHVVKTGFAPAEDPCLCTAYINHNPHNLICRASHSGFANPVASASTACT